MHSCTVRAVHSRTTPSIELAPPAGTDAAGPRPHLRGYRLGVAALVARPQELIRAKRVHGLAGGFVAGLALGLPLLLAGVPLALALLIAASLNVAVALWLPVMLLTPADRRLNGVVNRAAAASYMAWQRAYGKVPIPRSEEQQLLWIAAQPGTATDPDAVAIEGNFLLTFGRYAEAREHIERLPDDTPWWRLERSLGLAALDFESGGRGDLTEARAAAEAVHGERRATAIVSLAMEEAVRALIRGDDWEPPIARAAAQVPSSKSFGILAALYRARSIVPWLVVSELAIATVLYLVAGRANP
jgi:hypothetical protein